MAAKRSIPVVKTPPNSYSRMAANGTEATLLSSMVGRYSGQKPSQQRTFSVFHLRLMIRDDRKQRNSDQHSLLNSI